MRWLWKLITADLEITLALLMLLGSIIVLSWVQAGTGDINVNLTVISESPPPSGGGGGSSPYLPKETPVKKSIDLKSNLTIVDYSPKIIVYDRPNKLFVYIKIKEDLLQYVAAAELESQSTTHVTKEDLLADSLKDIVVKLEAPSAAYVATIANVALAPDDPNLIILEYFIPSFAPPKGLVDLEIIVQSDQTIIADKLKLYVVGALPPQELKVKIPVLDTRTIEILSGVESKISIRFTNTGNLDWDNLLQPIHIGTSRPRDRKSKFIHSSWPYSNRAALVVLPGIIKPGESFDAEFTVQAPMVKYPTKFTEYFALVADGLAWVEDSEFKINILVKPLSQPKSTTIVKPTPKPTTGGITQPQKPKTASPYQQTKKPASNLINRLNNFLQKIKLFFSKL